jgi:hypothetical protein
MAKRKVDGDTANSLVPAGARSAPGSLVDPALLEQLLHILHAAGQVANRASAENVFENHRRRRAQNTLRRQAAELRDFEEYLRLIIEQTGADLANDPSLWARVTHGLDAAHRMHTSLSAMISYLAPS